MNIIAILLSNYLFTIMSCCVYVCIAGTGSGTTKWILHQEGGGWCYNEQECVERSKTVLGSSTSWPKTASFAGFLSPNEAVNPDFHNWNVAFLMYCDGASFSGDV